MGLGDVKMLAMIGAFLGWQQVLVVLFLASLAGALVGLALTLRGRSLQSHLPFGTFLAVAALLASFAGQALAAAYVQSLP
jgi:leader peptidase (prepilin peptidase)/N-methyltransferase